MPKIGKKVTCARCEGYGKIPHDIDEPLSNEDRNYLEEKSLEWTGSVHIGAGDGW
jgi:hypothetical protein